MVWAALWSLTTHQFIYLFASPGGLVWEKTGTSKEIDWWVGWREKSLDTSSQWPAEHLWQPHGRCASFCWSHCLPRAFHISIPRPSHYWLGQGLSGMSSQFPAFRMLDSSKCHKFLRLGFFISLVLGVTENTNFWSRQYQNKALVFNFAWVEPCTWMLYCMIFMKN